MESESEEFLDRQQNNDSKITSLLLQHKSSPIPHSSSLVVATERMILQQQVEKGMMAISFSKLQHDPALSKNDIILSQKLPLEELPDNSCIEEEENDSILDDSIRKSISLPPPVLKPVLKEKKGGATTCSATAARGVRGLWDEGQADPFAQLNNKLLGSIFSFASLEECTRLGAVSQRWQQALQRERVTRSTMEATQVLDSMYVYYKEKERSEDITGETSKTFGAWMSKHSPKKLSLHSIYEKLSPDIFLPRVAGLDELAISNFSDLTDTHVHVMLLGVSDGQARTKHSKSSLRCLSLEHCPRLTNNVVASIVLHCPNLEELSLMGCEGVTDLSEFHTMKMCDGASMSAKKAPSMASLSNLFQQQAQKDRVVKKSSLGTLFAPQPKNDRKSKFFTSPGVPPKSSLTSMFAPLP